MSETENIPIAPGIKLEDLIDFKGDCIDPLALAIITESLDYALETSARRIKAAGKIYPKLGDNPVLSVVKAIRNELQRAPQCFPEGARVVKPPPVPVPEPKKTPTTATAPKTKVKATAEELKKVEAVIRKGGEGMTADLLELIKDKPDLMEIVRNTVPEEVAKVEKKSERSLPAVWGGTVKFEGTGKEKVLTGKFTSPQDLANRLGIVTRGASNMVKAFERAGFKVTAEGNGKPVKGETSGFIVERIKETPAKYRKAPAVAPEVLGGPPSPLKERWFTRRGQGGQVLGWDFVDPKTDMIVPEKFRKAGTAPAPPEDTIIGQVKEGEPLQAEEEPRAAELSEIEEES